MEYNLPSEIVKDLNFGDNAKNKIIAGVNKLAKAVKSTLGASGKCVIYEDARGKPVITKDGVTVAQSVVLFDPVENIGATLIKEAASNTVKQAGDVALRWPFVGSWQIGIWTPGKRRNICSLIALMSTVRYQNEKWLNSIGNFCRHNAQQMLQPRLTN